MARREISSGVAIQLIISSAGGYDDVAGNFLSWAEDPENGIQPLHTFGDRQVDSAALLMFLTGEQRLLTPPTSITLHLGAKEIGDSKYTARQLHELAEQAAFNDWLFADTVFKRCRPRVLTTPEILEKMRRGETLTAAQAVAIGLADGLADDLPR